MAEHLSDINEVYDVPPNAIREDNAIDRLTTPFIKQDKKLYSPRRRDPPISLAHLKGHPSYSKVSHKQLERKKTWVALNLIPQAPAALKYKLRLVGDIAGGVAIQPVADKMRQAEEEADSEHVTKTEQNENESQWSDMLKEAEDKERKGFGFNGMKAKSKQYGHPTTKDRLVNRRFLDETGEYEGETDREFCPGSALLDYDTIQQQYWVERPYDVRPSSVQQKSKPDKQKLLKVDAKKQQKDKKHDGNDQFLQKRLSYQHIEQESKATTQRSKQKTERLQIPQKYQRRLTLFKYEQEWQKDTLSNMDSPKMLGSYLNNADSARKQTKFILQSQRYLQTYIQGQAIDKIETPSLGVNSDDYRRQEEIKRMDLDSEPINLRYGQLMGTDISHYNKLRQATAQSYSKLADDSSHRTGHSTDYLYGINVNHEHLRDFMTDRVEGGLLHQLDLNSEKNYIQVKQDVDPYSLKAWMHKQAVSLKNLRNRKRIVHDDGTVEPIFNHSDRDWRCDRHKVDLFEASLIDDAIDKQNQTKKSLSHRINNKVMKITSKNIYLHKDFTLKRGKQLHASYKNNMLGDLIQDLDDYTKKLKEEGYILRRIPSIDIDPVDRQRQERAKSRQARVFQTLAAYYDQIENNPSNTRTRQLKRGKFQIEERRKQGSRSPEQIAYDEKKKFRQRRFMANTKKSQQPRIGQLRNTGFNLDVAKSMVIGSNAIDDSVNMVRKNIFYISRMKLKNQFQNDLVNYKVQKEIEKRRETALGPAIVPDPDYQQPPGSKVSKKKEVKDLKKMIRRYIAMSPNLYNDPKHPRGAYSIQNNFMQNPLKTHHFSSKQKQISSNTFNLSSVQVRGQKRPSKPASGSMSKVLSRKEVAVSETPSKQVSKSPESPKALIKPVMLDQPATAQNANSQDKLSPGTPSLIPAASPDLPKEGTPKGPGLRSSSTAPAGQAPRVAPGSKGGLPKPPSQKYGSKGRLRVNQDLVHASIKMQQQELKNSMMPVPDPTSSPMGALFRQSYQESYANPIIVSRKAKVQQEISQKFKSRELYLPVKDSQSRMKRIEERVKNVSIKMLNDRSMSTNIHSKYWTDARQSKTYASPAPAPVNNSLLQFKALIEEPSSAYFEKPTPIASNQLDSRAQMIMSQTLVSPNQLNSTQSRSFFSPSGGNNDDSRIFNLHDNQRAKNSIISSIKRDCDNFRYSQPVNASLDHHHLNHYTRANIMSSMPSRQYSGVQERTNYGQILGRNFKFKTLEKMDSKNNACISQSIANGNKVSQPQLRSALQVQNVNRRFLNQRFQPYTLEQQRSFTSNNDIDFVNLGDVVVHAPGDHRAGDDNEDTYFLSPDEVNQYIPPEATQAGRNNFDTINVDSGEPYQIDIRADSVHSNQIVPTQQGHTFQQLQSITQNSGGSRNQGYQTIEHLHQSQSRYGKKQAYPSQKQYKTIDQHNMDPLYQYDDMPGESQRAVTNKPSMIGSRLIMAANEAPYSSLVPYPVTEVAIKYPSIPNLQSQVPTGKPRRLTATNHAPRAYTGNPSRRSSLNSQSSNLMPQKNLKLNQSSNPYVPLQAKSALANAGGDKMAKLKMFATRHSKQ